MAGTTLALLDLDRDLHAGDISLGPDDFATSLRGFKLTKRTLHGGLREGVEVVEVDNGLLRFAVLPQRGMGIWKAWLGDFELGWRAPVKGPVHPAWVRIDEPSGLGWLDGFDELLCRCGLESNGAPEFDAQGRVRYPLHGRIANLPAHRVEASVDEATGEIAVTGVVDEARFHFQKLRLTSSVATRPGEAGFTVRDTVTNRAARAGEFPVHNHNNCGAPRRAAGARVLAPLSTLVPRNAHAAEDIDRWDEYLAPQAGYLEQVYFAELAGDAAGATQALLVNAAGTHGASVHFNTRQLPCFLVWKNTTALPDGYVTGIEPGTNFPNPRSFEKAHRRVVALAPGESREFQVRVVLHAEAASVERARAEIALLQAGVTPRVFREPQPGWCADADGE